MQIGKPHPYSEKASRSLDPLRRGAGKGGRRAQRSFHCSESRIEKANLNTFVRGMFVNGIKESIPLTIIPLTLGSWKVPEERNFVSLWTTSGKGVHYPGTFPSAQFLSAALAKLNSTERIGRFLT